MVDMKINIQEEVQTYEIALDKCTIKEHTVRLERHKELYIGMVEPVVSQNLVH